MGSAKLCRDENSSQFVSLKKHLHRSPIALRFFGRTKEVLGPGAVCPADLYAPA